MSNSPWELRVWNDDSKASLKTPTPITRLRFSSTRRLSAPYEFSFTVNLSDYVLADIGRGMYFELARGRTSSKGLWCNGYIVNVEKSTAQPMTCTITAASPSWFFAYYRTLGNYAAGPGLNFSSVLDLFAGVPA